MSTTRSLALAKILRPFLNVVRDPTRTDQIFLVISNPLIVNPESFNQVHNRLLEAPKCASLLESRYMGQWDLDTLLQLPAASFGHTYAKHMRDNYFKSQIKANQ